MSDKKTEIYSAIVVAALLIGTATGSAIVMLALSAVALSVGVVFFRPHGGAALRVMIVAAITAIIVACVTGFLLRR